MIFFPLADPNLVPSASQHTPVVATLHGYGEPQRRTWKLSATMYARDGKIKTSFTTEHAWLTGALQQLADVTIDTAKNKHGTRITSQMIRVYCDHAVLSSVKQAARRYGYR